APVSRTGAFTRLARQNREGAPTFAFQVLQQGRVMRTTPGLLSSVLLRGGLLVALFGAVTTASPAAALPGRYFRLMEAGLAWIEKRLEAGPTTDVPFDTRHYPGALLAAAVLYAKQHPDNPSCGDRKKLALALKVGDLLAADNAQGRLNELLNHHW